MYLTTNSYQHDPIKEWRIHIGAHKTATMHLQDMLQQRRAALADAGLDYIPLEDLRRLNLSPSAGSLNWRMRFGGWPMRRKIHRILAPMRRGPAMIALSEENLLGKSTELLTEALYPRAEQRLLPFASLIPYAKLHIFLSIRSFDGILPSAYAQVLRTQLFPGGFDGVRKRAVNRPPKWTELVGRVRKTLPDARLHVWTFEAYAKRQWDIISYYCGIEVPRGETLPPPKRTRSPSSKAIAQIEKLDPALDKQAHRVAAQRIVDADDSAEKYSPFSDGERSILAEAYAEDLEEMSNSFPDIAVLNSPVATEAEAQKGAVL